MPSTLGRVSGETLGRSCYPVRLLIPVRGRALGQTRAVLSTVAPGLPAGRILPALILLTGIHVSRQVEPMCSRQRCRGVISSPAALRDRHASRSWTFTAGSSLL